MLQNKKAALISGGFKSFVSVMQANSARNSVRLCSQVARLKSEWSAKFEGRVTLGVL